jgi:hypothetical protein
MQERSRWLSILAIVLSLASALCLGFASISVFHGPEFGNVTADGSVSKMPAYSRWESRNDALNRIGLALIVVASLLQIVDVRAQGQRSFNRSQRRILLGAIKPFRGHDVTVVCNRDDVESKAFGGEFVALFIAAGWWCGEGLVEGASGDIQTALQLQVWQPVSGQIFPAALAIATALQKIGWPHTGFQSVGPERVIVRVGRRPLYQ